MKWILPLLLVFTSCLKDTHSPESALTTFVEARSGAVVTRDFVLERVTGGMKQSFANMSDEDFAKFADLRNIRNKSFKILSKSCQEKKCFITYSTSYITSQNDKSAYVSEVKKIAEMISVEGRWLIAEVSNIKTYHEALDAINPLE